jgi:hypothetical protein
LFFQSDSQKKSFFENLLLLALFIFDLINLI